MENFNRKEHWEHIYSTKALNEVSWYQPTPETSLHIIAETGIPKDAAIIDVGGGDSFLVDHLLRAGYSNMTVLDISEKAIERAKARLGDDAGQVKWICVDAAEFEPADTYDLWHDRAAFHFLTDANEIAHYVDVASKHIKPGGNLIIGTFAKDGPLKCSGIEISQYDAEDLEQTFSELSLKANYKVAHPTPFDTIQNFTFCWFGR
ncbi:MAG: class I SAM-dependent methyltransferase [Flavobacteriales bacterium]|nr:class I SAM-dependent methyltransferase [Flavobacteriales bacterium]